MIYQFIISIFIEANNAKEAYNELVEDLSVNQLDWTSEQLFDDNGKELDMQYIANKYWTEYFEGCGLDYDDI